MSWEKAKKEISQLKHEVNKIKDQKQPFMVPEDPVEFFTKILHKQPYPYQGEFLRDKSALKVLRWCRRAGKTTVMSGSDIHFAALNPNSRIIVTSKRFTSKAKVDYTAT